MQIRCAEHEDLKAITEIYNQAILKGGCTADTEIFLPGQRMSWFKVHQSPEFSLYVYEKNEQVVGYAYLSPYRPGRQATRFTAEVSFYIHNDFQHEGIGSHLLEHLLVKSRELGYRTLIAILMECNIPSQKLLEKYGFAQWGRLPSVAVFDGEEVAHLYYGLNQ